jgi:DNA invertase Pin-like site-specific DNA recombinase
MTKRNTPVETLDPTTPRSRHLIGYARVSTLDQDPQLQIDALVKAGVDLRDIFEDTMTGSTMKRPGFEAMMKDLEDGDVIYVWKLDRLGRSVREVLNTFHDLAQRNITIVVLTQPGMDTSTATGRLLVTIMAAVAEMERDLIKERTKAGLAASRAIGRTGGRRHIATDDQIKAVRHLGAEAGAAKVGLKPRYFRRRLDQIRLKEMKEARANERNQA